LIPYQDTDDDGRCASALGELTERCSPFVACLLRKTMSVSRRLRFAREAIEAVVGVLTSLPDCAEKQQLVDEARACERTIDGWSHQAPTSEQHEATMKRVLKLHIAAARLARISRGGDA
jgi:hypothetical protein